MSPPRGRSGPAGNGAAQGKGHHQDAASASQHTPTACPDCAAVPAGRHLEHDATCPAGRSLDAVTASDAAWFAVNPGAKCYSRPISLAEVAEMRLIGVIPEGWSAAGDVTVTQLEPGVRARTFDVRVDVPPAGCRVRARSAFAAKCFRLADKALATGDVATDGDLIAVPDIMLAEFAAQGHDEPLAPTLRHADGRSVVFYRRPRGGAA